MREIRQSGSAGGEVQINEPSLPLSKTPCVAGQSDGHSCAFSPVVRGEGTRRDFLNSRDAYGDAPSS